MRSLYVQIWCLLLVMCYMNDQMRSKNIKNQNNTCAGKPIKAAMHMFSSDLIKGCNSFAEKAKAASKNEEVRFFNTACIFFATSAIEAKVNEWISVSQQCFKDEPKAFWHALAPLAKKLKIDEKWNLIASSENGILWDNSREPFQSFELITLLRNELGHFKGQFLPKDAPTKKKIKGLMNKLGVKSK